MLTNSPALMTFALAFSMIAKLCVREGSFEALVEALTPTPDPAAATFQPVKQRTASKIMYTGDGFLPEDWYFFHSKVT